MPQQTTHFDAAGRSVRSGRARISTGRVTSRWRSGGARVAVQDGVQRPRRRARRTGAMRSCAANGRRGRARRTGACSCARVLVALACSLRSRAQARRPIPLAYPPEEWYRPGRRVIPAGAPHASPASRLFTLDVGSVAAVRVAPSIGHVAGTWIALLGRVTERDAWHRGCPPHARPRPGGPHADREVAILGNEQPVGPGPRTRKRAAPPAQCDAGDPRK
jgi:hypothetical protein